MRTRGQKKAHVIRQHNRESLACCAPPEIICEIFLILRAKDINKSRTTAYKPSAYNLLVVTWVCDTWRQAALGCSGLWTTVYDHYPRALIDSMMKRSSPRPLFVFADSPHESFHPSRPKNALKALLKGLPRMRELYLASEPDVNLQEAQTAVRALRACSTLPLLHILSLDHLDAKLIPETEFSSLSTLNLHILRLTLGTSWSTALFPSAPNLTTLILSGWSFIEHPELGVPCRLRTIAERFPRLNSLALTGHHFSDNAEPTSWKPEPIAFHGLTRLKLGGEADIVACLAVSITIPQSCTLHVDLCSCACRPSWGPIASYLLLHLMHRRTDGPAPVPFAASLDFTHPVNVSAALGSAILAGASLRWSMTPPPVVFNWTKTMDRYYETRVARCREQLPLQSLRIISINRASGAKASGQISKEVSRASWALFLTQSPRVETAQISANMVEEVALFHTLAREDVWPALRCLIVEGICCITPAEEGLSLCAKLEQCLRARAECGVPVGRVLLPACRQHVNWLVRVSGIELMYDDEFQDGVQCFSIREVLEEAISV